MEFRNKDIELGMRFYTFISDDEYKILTIVKINEDKKSGIFMDEETFKLKTISKEELDENYTLLDNYRIWFLCKFGTKKEFIHYHNFENENFWLCGNTTITNFLSDQGISYPYYVKIKLRLVTYKFMKKPVLDKLINYIIKLHYPKFPLSEEDHNDIWKQYFGSINNSDEQLELVLDYSNRKDLDMDAIVNNEAKIPDDIIDEAEELLNTYILTYDPYELDDSVNMNNVNMKHFFIYINDKYYIILYVIDTMKVNIATRKNLNEHMDVVNFMLK